MAIIGFRATQKTVATSVEMFRKILDQGIAGDNVGVLLRGTKKDEVERGQVLLAIGLVFWVFLLFRGIAPARQDRERPTSSR